MNTRALIFSAVALTGLASTSTAHAQWVTGGAQFAKNYFTEVLAEFKVPTPPSVPSTAVTNIWPGIEDAQGKWVLQPVLSYGFLQEHWLMGNQVYGPSNNNPNNTSCPTGNATYCDEPQAVNDGDTIWAGVVLDWSNLGPYCNTNTGTNCNYNILWIDWTNGASSELIDWLQPTPLIWAQGMVFEANVYNGLGLQPPTGCFNYPWESTVVADVLLFEASGSNLRVQDTTSLTAYQPGTPPFTGDPFGCFFASATQGSAVQLAFGGVF